MLMEGGLPTFFTTNGNAYPATETIHMQVGERVLFRFIGSSNNFIHPMHIHGGPFTIVAADGTPCRRRPESRRTPSTSVRESVTTSSGRRASRGDGSSIATSGNHHE